MSERGFIRNNPRMIRRTVHDMRRLPPLGEASKDDLRDMLAQAAANTAALGADGDEREAAEAVQA